MDNPFIDPSKVPALVAGGAGAFLSMLFQRNTSKLTMLTTLSSAEIADYYFANPIWSVLHSAWPGIFDAQWQGPVALTLGLIAIFVFGGVMKMAEDFWRDPWKTIISVVSRLISRVLPWRKGE